MNLAAASIIAETKLMPPRHREGMVVRQELDEVLRASDAPLVVVSGPAGSGKSVLLAHWHHAETIATWMSFDEADNDPNVLWSSLIEAYDRTIEGFAESCRAEFAASGAATTKDVVAIVTAQLGRAERPVCAFLDDVHMLDNDVCRASLRDLARSLPPGCRVVVASRRTAPFPLAAMRLAGRVLEVDKSSLAMSDDEARMLFDGLEIQVSSTDVDELNAHAEGWVAGLQLAALALEQVDDSQEFLASFRGSDRLVGEFMISEVIDRLRPDDQVFLLRTSILTRLTGTLTDAVARLDHGSERLARLERTNAFVVPLDRNGLWYRYHHLFGELLADLLRSRYPCELDELHRSAFEWFRDQGLVIEAIEHAFEAGERHEAAVLVSAYWYDLSDAGRIDKLRSLLERFDSDEIATSPPLALAASWVFGLTGEASRSRQFMAAASREHEGEPLDGSASMTSALALARSVFGWDGVARALQDAELAYSLEPLHSRWHPMATWLVADRHIWNDDWELAKPYLDEVVHGPPGHDAVRALALSMLAVWHLAHDEPEQAQASSEAAYRLIEGSALDDIATAASVHAIRARAAAAVGDLAQAKRSLAAARGPISRVDTALPLGGIHSRILMAEAALAAGDVAEARHNVRRGSELASKIADTGGFVAHLRRLSAQIAPADDEHDDSFAASLSEREVEIVRLLSSSLTLRQIGEELFVSRNTIKSHVRRIYRRLGVSSREGAVAEVERRDNMSREPS